MIVITILVTAVNRHVICFQNTDLHHAEHDAQHRIQIEKKVEMLLPLNRPVSEPAFAPTVRINKEILVGHET